MRPPLGAPYDGVCRAGAERVHPEPQTLTESCNMGYAAARCSRFRAGEGEAVRFAIGPGGEDEGVAVRWSIEAGGLPVRSGELTAAALEGESEGCAAPALVLVQSRAYLSSYRTANSAMLR
jgi:hypothetical protein